MPGLIIDGMDVEVVRDTVGDAVRRARAGEGPTLIEAKTYRFRGHFEGDPQTYRPRAEVEEWRKRDPIVVFGDRLTSGGRAGPDDLDRIRQDAGAEVEAAAQAALAAPMPGDDRIYQHVYA
jgi:pyruvate dehydrogenase E1 component alpha subunit